MSKSPSQSQPPQADIDRLIGLYNQGCLAETVLIGKKLARQYPLALILYEILGASNLALGNISKTLKNYKKAIQINANHTDAYNNIGIVLFDQGNYDKAIEHFQKAVEIEPSFGNAHYNLGNALKEKGDLEKAIESYKNSLLINPKDAEVLVNYGNALKDFGELDQAIDCYSKALGINPEYAEAYNNMGNALYDMGAMCGAIKSYKRALKAKPEYAEAHNNMGNALQDHGNLEQAIVSHKRAIELKPNYSEAYNSLGAAMQSMGSIAAAIDNYESALKINPDYQSCRVAKLHQQALICDWEGIKSDPKKLALGLSKQPIEPFYFLSHADAPERHQMRSEIYAQRTFKQKPLRLSPRPDQKPKRLRVGYFSTDFQQHPVASLIAKVIETHDRKYFEIYGYSLGKANCDEMRLRLIKGFDVFTDVRDVSDKKIALLARQHKIDIAVDLTGYTRNGRTGIFAFRAAPIQINYLGYPGTMGANFIDYIIADQNLIPKTSQKYYSEKPIYLPYHYQAQDDTLLISDNTVSRAALGLPEDGFVFCAIHNAYKITPSEFDIWMRLLQRVEGSVLLLLESNGWIKNNLQKEALKRGVNFDQLVFTQRVPHNDYLAQLQLADLYLDAFTYNAGATASNALWAGLPVLTKTGKSYASRMASSLLFSIGLPELITTTEVGYEKLALDLSTNPKKLASIKQQLAKNRLVKPLFKTDLFTSHLEEGYRVAYQRYFDGKSPRTIYVQK